MLKVISVLEKKYRVDISVRVLQKNWTNGIYINIYFKELAHMIMEAKQPQRVQLMA